MAQFILIDHSLKKVGGHHFDYALHVATAAERAGYQVTLATHRRFRQRRQVPGSWRVLRPFRFDTYSPYAVFCGSRSRAERKPRTSAATDVADDPKSSHGLKRLWSWLCCAFRRVDRWRRTRHFAAACRRVLSRRELTADDHVFFATLSEFDLQGLVEYLERDPRTRAANWHLQFHFNFLEGRDPEYDAQTERLQFMRKRFRQLLERVPYHRLFFYNTSDELARQYNRLGVAQFQNLAYPIHPAFFDPRRPRQPGPLRITCGGAIRLEKGQQQLTNVLGELWNDYFASGKAQLHVQSNKSWFQLPVPASPASTPVVYVPHPLAPQKYVQLIQQADVGLMMYDSQRYFTRRAGVLGELLAAGVPVVVPAGCWLAEQIAEPNFAYLDRIHAETCEALQFDAAVCARHQFNELTCGGSDSPATFTLDGNTNLRDALVRFRWQRPLDRGTYLRLTVESHAADGRLLQSRAAVVGHRSAQRAVGALLALHPQATTIHVKWQNAYRDTPIEVTAIEVLLLPAGATDTGHRPVGAVGLAAAEPEHVAQQLREILDHYEHYRQAAGRFAAFWSERHHPRHTVAQLLARAATPTTAFHLSKAA